MVECLSSSLEAMSSVLLVHKEKDIQIKSSFFAYYDSKARKSEYV